MHNYLPSRESRRDRQKVQLVDAYTNSLLILNEYVISVLETSPNNLIVHLFNTDLLIAYNFKVLHRVVESDPGNTSKDQILPLPGYDPETLPFVVMSGRKSLNILNVKIFKM